MNPAAVLAADRPQCLALAAEAFPHCPVVALRAEELSPAAPFEGRLFALLEEIAAAAAPVRAPAPLPGGPFIGLVAPAVWYGDEHDGLEGAAAADTEPAAPDDSPDAAAAHAVLPAAVPPAVLAADHVNLVARGPLTGRWPADRPRTFPSLCGIYRRPDGESFADAEDEPQEAPACVRLPLTGPVYSLVVAGVADAERLTSFERRQMRRCGLRVAADLLAPPVIVAAYYDLAVAAVLAPRPAKSAEWK